MCRIQARTRPKKEHPLVIEKLSRLLALTALASIAAIARAAEISAPAAPAPCRIHSAAVGASAAARCLSLSVPEDPAVPDGARIQLSIAVIPALRTKAEPDPLFLISGGPGQAASDLYFAMAPAFARIQRDRDIVIVDQRGTGGSARFDCAMPNDAEFVDVSPSLAGRLAKQCLAAFARDARFYTTSVAVQDLERVRIALGYDAINLYGVSYGTRVAQHYMRRYPRRVRSAILDGVVPPGLALGPRIALDAQTALDAIFERCVLDVACNKAFPAIREQFATLRERLSATPAALTIADPVSATPLDVRFGVAELTAAVRLLSYSDEAASLLPLLIHEANSANRPHGLAAQFELIKRSLGAQIAYGMHFSVACSEDAPRWQQESVTRDALAETYIGTQLIDAMEAICADWPRGPVDEDFHASLDVDVPTLLLSGANDPVTPVAYGERARATLSNAKHLVLNGQGHGQLLIGCMPQVAAKFVATASFDALGEACLYSVTPAPFFLSHAGPAP
jgi:pimeloyl-ACP methyl ester carboxylesterase